MAHGIRASDGILLELIADEDSRRIIDRLLIAPATQKELRDDLDLQSGPLSRQMKALADNALVVRERSHSPYSLTFPERTRALLLAAADLARDVSEARHEADVTRSKALRRDEMRARSTFDAEHEEARTGEDRV